MLDFIIFVFGTIFLFSAYSCKEYNTYNSVYKILDYFKFNQKSNFAISNEGTDNEFIIYSEWNFQISKNLSLQFDIWCLIDLHKLFWVLKFHNKIKNLGLLNL